MSYRNLCFPKNSVFLVTGGGGFIGSNLCEAILNMGYKVKCLDNLSLGKQENIDIFLANPNYSFVRGDIRDFDTCTEACNDVDYVLHHAALGSVPQSIQVPLLYCENNICGTLNMLEAARRSKVKKFIYASSASVYGDDINTLKNEGHAGNMLSPYAVCKSSDEAWAKQYTLHYRLDTYGLRYFNVFGRRQDPGSSYAAVIPKFIKQMLKGESPVIFGDGEQTRDFTYIENVIEANLKACIASHETAGDVFNIACGECRTLMDVYRSIARLLNVNEAPIFAAAREGDIKYSRADISKAKTILGYNPEYNFEQGMYEAILWYKEFLS